MNNNNIFHYFYFYAYRNRKIGQLGVGSEVIGYFVAMNASPTSPSREGEMIAACSEALSPTSTGTGEKCVKCGKRYKKSGCSQQACLKCCSDENCDGHRALRGEKRRQDEIFAGTHNINRLARRQRSLAVKNRAFTEPSFHFLNETLLIWSSKDFLANPKWREDAIRRSVKNKRSREAMLGDAARATIQQAKKKNEGRRKKFQRVMEQLYEASVATL